MNKTELIAEVAKKCAMSKKDAEKAVSATFDTIAEVLCAGSKYSELNMFSYITEEPYTYHVHTKRLLKSICKHSGETHIFC